MPFRGALQGPGKVTGSAPSGLELRQLPETKSSGSSSCAPLPLCHHDRDFQCLEENMPEHLYQKHIFEGSPEEKPMLIWVNAASCILQTTIVKDVTYLCVPSETSQMPSKHQRNLCRHGLSVQPTPNRSALTTASCLPSFSQVVSGLTVSRFGSSSISTIW